VEALTSEVLFYLWEWMELYGGFGRIFLPQKFKRFTVAAAL
jgi:hypothetical protein